MQTFGFIFFFVALGLCLWDAYRRNAECSQTTVAGNGGQATSNRKPLQNSSLYKHLLMPIKKEYVLYQQKLWVTKNNSARNAAVVSPLQYTHQQKVLKIQIHTKKKSTNESYAP